MNDTIEHELDYDEPEPMGLLHGIGLYLAALALTSVAFYGLFYGQWLNGWLYLLIYFGCGYGLNRTVLVRLITWHPIYDTLDVVTGEKIKFFLFWPFTYGILLSRLVVDRVL